MIKLNNIQAKNLTGIYNGIWATDPLYVEDNFWVIQKENGFNGKYGILKRYLKRLKTQGKITVIDMSKPSTERTKIMAALKKETRENKIEYKGKYIITEL